MAAPSTGNDYGACEAVAVLEGADIHHRCLRHGGYFSIQNLECQTVAVLLDIQAERTRQFAAYGTNEALEDGTGPDVKWATIGGDAGQWGATDIETALRADYEFYKAEHGGLPTWMHLVREEMAEAFAEADPSRLRAELVQVAALCTSWIEKIDAREWAASPGPHAVP